MVDQADIATEDTEIFVQNAIREAAKDIPPGRPGECDFCGEWSGRLIRGARARCRDERKLP